MSQEQQQTPLDVQPERDKCKKADKRKSSKKILQIQLPDKAQPQSQPKSDLQQQQQKRHDALLSQNLANSSQTTQLAEKSRPSAHRTVTHSADATACHTSSSDASTASCDSDSEEAVSEKLASMCHHCLRPQIEMQLRHLRPHQRRQWSRLLQQQHSQRRNSKTRKEVSWSGGGGGGVDGKNGEGRSGGGGGGAIGVEPSGYGAGDYLPPTGTTYTTGAHWSRRDVSAAVRYRCPQVGPKPAPYHFHHPQQLHNAYQLQLLLQQCEYVPPAYHQQQQQHDLYYKRQAPLHNNNMDLNTSNTTTTATANSTTTTSNAATTITIECDSQPQSQIEQQKLLYQQQRNQNTQFNQNLHAMTTATTTIKTATSSGCSVNGCTSNTSLVEAATAQTGSQHAAATHVAMQPQGTALPAMGRATRTGAVSDSELQLQLQQQPSTSEPPSLVKKV